MPSSQGPSCAGGGLRVPVVPAEAPGALAQTGGEVAAAERAAAVGFGLPVRCAAAARRGRGRGRTASSSMADSRAYIPEASPGARIQDGAGHVEGGHPVLRTAVGRGVHDAGGHGGLLDELLDPRGVRDDLVGDGGEHAVAVGAQPDPLQGGCAVADDRRHVPPGQGELDRATGVPRGHRGEDGLGARGALGAEAAADVLGDDGDAVRVEPERPWRGCRGRRSAPWLESWTVEMSVGPPRGGGVRLHGVVVQPAAACRWRRSARGAAANARIGVAAFADSRVAAVGLLGRVEAGVVRGEGRRRARWRRTRRGRPPRRPARLRGSPPGRGRRASRGAAPGRPGARRGSGRRAPSAAARCPGSRTVCTPGTASASAVRIAVTRPLATVAGTIQPYRQPGRGVLGGVAGGAGDLVPALAADYGRARRPGESLMTEVLGSWGCAGRRRVSRPRPRR